jgi:muramoyltetrapeptide carboxypeptidase
MRPEVADQASALAARLYPENTPEIHFHPQCFLTQGHFAGPDPVRAQAVLDIANDPRFDALWLGRGGYGAGRLLDAVMPGLEPAARDKAYLGYSDGGFLLGALYARRWGRVAHGPVVQDLVRTDGEAAFARGLGWLMGSAETAESTVGQEGPVAAFNLCILSHLIGTPWQPDLTDHVLMLEEVSEPIYRIDRFLQHVLSNPEIRKVRGVRLGRCSDIIPNDPDFGQDAETVCREACARAGVAYLGPADIGHDADNKIVPFG